ncbi:MAG: Fe-S cluster assembly protein SufD [Acidimicrobiia bacterium]
MKLDRAFLSLLSASSPEWLTDVREQALSAFAKLEMPTESEEVWRYLDLDFEIDEFAGVEGPGELLEGPDLIGDALNGTRIGGATVVDGYVVETSEQAISLSDADRRSDALEKLVSRGAPVDLDIFSAAHHAFLPDLVFIDVPAGQVDVGPRYVDIQASQPNRVSFPHVALAAGENSETSVVLSLRSQEASEQLVVPGIDVDVADGARCGLTISQGLGPATRSIAHLRARVGRDATLIIAEAGLGASLSRLHLTIDLEGAGGTAQVIGLYFGDRDQVLDYRAFINHIGPSTTSDMVLKGAVEDQARSVFTGLIKIENEAIRAHAFQTNRNLVLSDGAQAQSVPNLEILCDEVMCGHASTSGPLELEHLYYLRSRGLSQTRAERLLIRGFFDEVLRRFPQSELAAPIGAEVSRKFIEAQEEGRV